MLCSSQCSAEECNLFLVLSLHDSVPPDCDCPAEFLPPSGDPLHPAVIKTEVVARDNCDNLDEEEDTTEEETDKVNT